MLLSKYATCDSKNPKINKHEEASVLPSSLGIKQYFKIIPLVDPLVLIVLNKLIQGIK